MRGIYFDGKLAYREDLQMPECNPEEALIKVILAAVCNTDKEIVRGYKGFNGILGHEFVGIVEASSDENLIGKRVVGEINIGCGECGFCKKGLHNHCRERKVLGITGKNGAYAEYLTLPNRNIHIVPDGVPDIAAVFTEPLAAALQIVEKHHIRPTDSVAIIGDGKLAQLVAQVISLTACDLTVIGKHREKLSLLDTRARTVLLSDAAFENVFDAVIDCTGNEQGLLYAERLVKATGTIILKSTYNGKAMLNPTDWVVNELRIVGTRCGPLHAALRLLERRLVEVEPLLDGIYALKDYEKVFRTNGGLKKVFDPEL